MGHYTFLIPSFEHENYDAYDAYDQVLAALDRIVCDITSKHQVKDQYRKRLNKRAKIRARRREMWMKKLKNQST